MPMKKKWRVTLYDEQGNTVKVWTCPSEPGWVGGACVFTDINGSLFEIRGTIEVECLKHG